MATVVQKYGGSSVATVDKIKEIAKRLIQEKENGNNVVVVVSAMGKTTNGLIDMANQVSKNPSKREMDMLLSTGEQVTISLLTMTLKSFGHDAISLTGFQAGILTEGSHTKNRIKDINIENVKNYLKENKIVVVAGFQGMNENGDITTLGRGGSDTTAVALAAKLKCPCEIYTDVDGIYGIDPRLYPEAKKLDYITYEEMMEMASLGSGIMETRSVEIGLRYNVPIYVGLNSGEKNGTYIKEFDETMEQNLVTGVSATDNILMVTLNNIPYNPKNISSIFESLAVKNVNIDMISQTSPSNNHVDVSFTTSKDDESIIDEAISALKSDIPEIDYIKESNLAKVSVVGTGMRNQSGVASKIFNIFAENNIEFKQITTSEISISYTIKSNDKEKTVTILCKELGL
ncbi:aspartate kinase LysC [Gottschalkia acidurici 9a]|uniref:Aspartokinase n=1 Tax=Gottschalkia acidurici (strain ATCC 7906 / DSM 604 / BCRC 14475 / CIP 104303 / KCTC 5404 / NCIMB 10678 / 9a) TaxID=1128398 RepID=K0AY74_GOTA9|nr:aspartate kinase [Gottschalkia acidurici]AFS78194.1 aspartate kinase LysC [Gottschalkia acidurici 9a]